MDYLMLHCLNLWFWSLGCRHSWWLHCGHKVDVHYYVKGPRSDLRTALVSWKVIVGHGRILLKKFGENKVDRRVLYGLGMVLMMHVQWKQLNERSDSNITCHLLSSHLLDMMTSSNGNIFRITGHLCGEFTGHRWIPHTKACDTEIWCSLWSALE